MLPPGGLHLRLRILITGGLLAVWAIVLLVRICFVQVVRHEAYLKRADDQQMSEEPIQPRRGVLYDRTGHRLAMSLERESVSVNPMLLKDPSVASEILAKFLHLDESKLAADLESLRRHHRGFYWVKRRLSRAEAESVHRLKLKWVDYHREFVREYPNEDLAAHVVGAVNFDQHGYLGVEKSLERELAGEPGERLVLKDVRGRVVEAKALKEARPGADIHLTLDARIQFVAERELARQVVATNSKAGSIVVMDPRNGDVLALASFPGFHPKEPYRENEKHRRFNHGVQVPFEPGSVFKIITMAAAVETGRVTPGQMVNCGGGGINLYGRIIHDHHAYGQLTATDVIAKSSNIGIINVALLTGEEALKEYINRFEFGRRTGIALPAESRGQVRQKWEATSIGSIAMGHELSATTLQLARAGAVFANGGLLVTPRLVSARQPHGGPREELPAAPPRRILKPDTAITVRRMMERVVLAGTGTAARLNGYSAAGKTGSAQIWDPEQRVYTHLYNASFLGFAPVTNPALLCVVTVNGASKFGGAVAAPVFRTVMNEALRLMNVPRDLPEAEDLVEAGPAEVDDLAIAGLNLQPPELAPEGAETAPAATASAEPPYVGPVVPNFAGMSRRDVVQESLAQDMKVTLEGYGLARWQNPPAGSPLQAGVPVRVLFSR